MFLVRALSHAISGNGESVLAELENAGVPVSAADCRICADPCDEGHGEYPNFKMDHSDIRGTVKAYRRMVLISTGKSDWPMHIMRENESLAKVLHEADSHLYGSAKHATPPSSVEPEPQIQVKPATGVFRHRDASRLTILNSSHTSFADDSSKQSVIVLPDYKAVSEVPVTREGAEMLWNSALHPGVGRAGAADIALKTWPLPYDCLILLCSHKKVDNRCHIASIKLQAAFSHTLAAEGWDTDMNLEDLSVHGPPMENLTGITEDREAEMLKQLRSIGEHSHRALILKTSHIGGHKYAGNVIINFPQGSCVWYGHVTPHEVQSIVRNTIIGGKILPDLLRGGLDISRPSNKCFRDW